MRSLPSHSINAPNFAVYAVRNSSPFGGEVAPTFFFGVSLIVRSVSRAALGAPLKNCFSGMRSTGA